MPLVIFSRIFTLAPISKNQYFTSDWVKSSGEGEIVSYFGGGALNERRLVLTKNYLLPDTSEKDVSVKVFANTEIGTRGITNANTFYDEEHSRSFAFAHDIAVSGSNYDVSVKYIIQKEEIGPPFTPHSGLLDLKSTFTTAPQNGSSHRMYKIGQAYCFLYADLLGIKSVETKNIPEDGTAVWEEKTVILFSDLPPDNISTECIVFYDIFSKNLGMYVLHDTPPTSGSGFEHRLYNITKDESSGDYEYTYEINTADAALEGAIPSKKCVEMWRDSDSGKLFWAARLNLKRATYHDKHWSQI